MNEKYIWEYLMAKIGNPYGVAAVMGNLMAESSLNPICVTGLKKTRYDTSWGYVLASENGTQDFANDGVAFGLAQWCYKTRKQRLLNYAKEKKMSVGNLDAQLGYLCEELPLYKEVWEAVTHADNVREASDLVMLKYERPADTGETMKKRRADYSLTFFARFSDSDRLMPTEKTELPATAELGSVIKAVVKAIQNVNVRSGNGKEYAKIGLLSAGSEAKWVATAQNGWFAIKFKYAIGWVDSAFAELIPEG